MDLSKTFKRSKQEIVDTYRAERRIWVCNGIDTAILTIPKIGQGTTVQTLQHNPQCNSVLISEFVKNPTSKIIRFTRSNQSRLVSAGAMMLRDFGFNKQNFSKFVDICEERCTSNVHTFPPNEFCSLIGYYLPTHEYALENINDVLMSLEVEPSLEKFHNHPGEYDRENWHRYYTPELWDRVDKIYEND